MKQLCIAILLLLSLGSNAQTITTYASGSGSSGIYDPQSLAFDNYGNLYCPTNAGNKVLKISSIGVITTFAGTGTAGYTGDGGPATAAELYQPGGVATDTLGNVYITDAGNNCVRKVDAVTGIIMTIAGNGTPGYGGDGGSATSAILYAPNNLCFDKHGNLYIADVRNYRVRKIGITGIITTAAGTGILGRTGDGGPATAAECDPGNIAIDAIGNLYITDSVNSIRKIDTTGVITTIAGDTITGSPAYTSDGVPALGANIDPIAVAFDSYGDILISDGNNNRVREIDTLGIIHTVVGDGTAGDSGDGGPATAAELNYATGIAFDQCGNLYVAQINEPRIRKISYPPPPIALTNTLTTTADTVCTGTAVIYTTTAAASSGTITYQWYVNGSLAGATSSSYIYTPANGDSIRCVATAMNTCTSAVTSSNTINMVVNPYTVPTITVTAPASVPMGSTVTVNATVAGAGSGYSINWYDNSVLFNTTTVPVVTYVKGAGTDHITATVVPVGGCYDSVTSGVVSVGVEDEGVTSPGLSGGAVTVYPNPVKGDLSLELRSFPSGNSEGAGTYRLCNIVGVVLQEGGLVRGANSIDMRGFAAGVYVLEVTDGEGGETIKKIIKGQ